MLYLIAMTNLTPSKGMNANVVDVLQPWRLKSSDPALQSQSSGINTSVIHKIREISLHSCHILGAKSSQQELQHGHVLVMGGGFKECNKAVLVVEGLIPPFQPLQSDHEEADTRMILHHYNASQDHDRVVIQSPDTDVAVLATHFFNSLACKQLWFRTGVKDKLRFIPINSLVESLGSDTCASLQCFHALTGCDSTSGLYGIGKKKAWMTLRKNA